MNFLIFVHHDVLKPWHIGHCQSLIYWIQIWSIFFIWSNLIKTEWKFQSDKINMKPFETALNNFAFLGLEWDKDSKKYLCTKKFLLSQFSFFLIFTSNILLLVNDAQTFYDYISELMLLLTSILCSIICFVISIKVDAFNNLVENTETLINKSESEFFNYSIKLV